MKLKPTTLAIFLSLASNNDAFTVPSLPRNKLSFRPNIAPSNLSPGITCIPTTTTTYQTNLFSSRLFDDDDEDDYDDDDDDSSSSPDKDIINAALANQKGEDDESSLTQSLSSDQRKENLAVIRQIFKYDLAYLQRRRDYSGWVEAKRDLKKRQAADPWYALNKKLKDAAMLDEESEVVRLQELIEKVGGPPPGIKPLKEYAVVSEVYDTGMSLNRAESIARFEQTRKNTQKWQAMIAQREANEEQEEKDWIENPHKAEEEARARRNRSMGKIFASIEEKRKKAEDKAKEIQNKYKDGDVSKMTPLDRALKMAKEAEEERQKKEREAIGLPDTVEAKKLDSDESIAKVKDSDSNSTNSSGRPRLPGDMDVTRGEIEINPHDCSDTTTKDAVRIQVTSSYNSAQSDPPMRKHCFQYTIQITNLSNTDTIQLLSRRFEIQTVGARQKDIVQGQGVTGRQPILKPGETFEYTSTAPLSVRPLGTTSIAARMKGTYTYNILDNDGKSVGDEMEAELGMFHFVFPAEQRVKPVAAGASTVEEDEEDDDDDKPTDSTSASVTSSSASAPTTAPASSPSLPGDEDMKTGKIATSINDSSSTVTNSIRVAVTTQYREERSDTRLQKHCFAYNIRITNESTTQSIQLLSRRFEIQTISSAKKDVVQGPGVTGRQPILKPGESFEYTSTAPLNVKPLDETPVVARMSGEYNYVLLDGDSNKVSENMQAKLGIFHFVLPQVA